MIFQSWKVRKTRWLTSGNYLIKHSGFICYSKCNPFLSTLKKDNISLFLFCALCDLKVISRALYSTWLAVTLLYLKARFYLQPYLLLPPPRLSIPSLFISLSLSLSLSPSFSLSHLSPTPTLISFLLSRIKCILFELVLVSCVGSWPLVRAWELMREHVLRH